MDGAAPARRAAAATADRTEVFNATETFLLEELELAHAKQCAHALGVHIWRQPSHVKRTVYGRSVSAGDKDMAKTARSPASAAQLAPLPRAGPARSPPRPRAGTARRTTRPGSRCASRPIGKISRIEAGLAQEMAHEFASVGELPPDARQEEGALPPLAENEPVTVRLERFDEFPFAARRDRPRVGEDRDVELEPFELGFASGAKRGSPKPACTAFAAVSSISGRRGAGEPMQPLRRPPSVSVTKVPRNDESVGERRPSRAIGGFAPRSAPRRRGSPWRSRAEGSRSAASSRAEAAYSNAKAP